MSSTSGIPVGSAPDRAMVLAAGLGLRMRPLTTRTAKPLLPLGGRPLLDHALDRLAAASVRRVVVNTHWQAELVAAHLAAREDIGLGPPATLQREVALLDTGGAVRAALADLAHPGRDTPFYVVNGDSFWLDGPRPALQRLAQAMDDSVDGVLLVHRSFQVLAEVGRGDFAVDPWGKLRRPRESEIVPYIYAGVQLVRPALFDRAPDGAFSMNLLWDQALAAGRLRGVVHDGLWFHLSTPEDLRDAEYVLHARETGMSA